MNKGRSTTCRLFVFLFLLFVLPSLGNYQGARFSDFFVICIKQSAFINSAVSMFRRTKKDLTVLGLYLGLIPKSQMVEKYIFFISLVNIFH